MTALFLWVLFFSGVVVLSFLCFNGNGKVFE